MEKVKVQRKLSELQNIVKRTMNMMNVDNVELTLAQAKRIYGSWFVEAVKNDQISPCREGPHGRAWYSVSDILELKNIQRKEQEKKH